MECRNTCRKINFSVHGCPDPIFTDEVGTHSHRDGDILEVTCDRTGEVSILNCDAESRTWVGERADCSEGKLYTKLKQLN